MSKLFGKIKTMKRLRKELGIINTIKFAYSRVFRTTFRPIEKKRTMKMVKEITENRFRNLQAIPSICVEASKMRLNVVTDSIAATSLLGGVATALIVATEFARRNKMALRIITRTEPAVPTNFLTLLKNNNLEPFDEVEFYSDYDRDLMGNKLYKLEVSPLDVFFATSWWSAVAIRKTTIRKRFYYIIQEVETFFYPHGEEHYLCSQLLEDKNIDYIINSRYLYDYFKVNVPQIIENGVWFNPAFSVSMYNRENFEKRNGCYRLFFYARPNNPRNMYYYGLQLLNCAIERGIINPKEWIIYFAGSELEHIAFSNGVQVQNLGLMDWKEYAEFLSTVDLTISLMYTPHPSYPPYDTVCSGGVVLTNSCLNKQEFPECKNIIMADLEKERFFQGLCQAIELAKDYPKRKRNYENSNVPREWIGTLQKTFKFMEDRL